MQSVTCPQNMGKAPAPCSTVGHTWGFRAGIAPELCTLPSQHHPFCSFSLLHPYPKGNHLWDFRICHQHILTLTSPLCAAPFPPEHHLSKGWRQQGGHHSLCRLSQPREQQSRDLAAERGLQCSEQLTDKYYTETIPSSG